MSEPTITCGTCRNCIRWKEDTSLTSHGWIFGHCYYLPERIERKSTAPACIHATGKMPDIVNDGSSNSTNSKKEVV